LKKIGSRLEIGQDFEVVDPNSDERYNECWSDYHQMMKRRGVTIEMAKTRLRKHNTLIGAMLIRRGYADGMLCGVTGRFEHHLQQIEDVIGKAPGCTTLAAMNELILPGRAVFICDTQVNEDPSAEQLAEIAQMAAEEVRRLGIEPKVAMLSHSNFGSAQSASARKMAAAAALFHARSPEIESDGEMRGDAALSEEIRQRFEPDSRLSGEANVLIMPNLDAANISYSLLKMTGGEGVTIGPILLGAARPVHVLTPGATVRRIVNMTALTVVGAATR
jgi:malate dehydrogenase (oxaloacetate-decarboxylating)(NADP+)